ncbi:MAG: serine/threonine protein kinase [Myxococcaceae bacterium]|nr:serine/threonine protein kinase [Myxococcaceae bacterium]
MPLPSRPQRLGPYEVVAKIAGGGMATIYMGRTRDPKTGVEKVAAIKVIRNELRKSGDFVDMFLDEARILSRLSHPNVIQTLEYGADDEHHFIAMELLLGRTLMDVWDLCAARGLALRLDLSAFIAARTADGLHCAHELAGPDGSPLHLIHRDVNPSNIFLTYDGRVKLFDFGLAKALGRTAKSSAGIVKGKLPYLSPEQVMQFPLDRRVDVFTLGATLWEMTTMKRLFKRDDDVETVKAVRTGVIPDPRAIVPHIPATLAAITKKALERSAAHRYDTARDFAQALDAFLAETAKPAELPQVLGAMLDSLFPGDRAKQEGWLRKTRALPTDPRRATLPPPASLPLTRDDDDS